MSSKKSKQLKSIAKQKLEALSEFRYQLRRFLRFSEIACRQLGATPLQYQVMLHVRGFPGRDWATVGEIAGRLQAHPHGTLALIQRCEAKGYIYRKRSTTDRRQVEVHLRPMGERCLTKLATLHHAELNRISETIQIARITTSASRRNGRASRR